MPRDEWKRENDRVRFKPGEYEKQKEAEALTDQADKIIRKLEKAKTRKPRKPRKPR